MITKKAWIEKAKDIICDNLEIINEVDDMVGSDYSRNKGRLDRAKWYNQFLQQAIELLEGDE